uniref:KASH5-like coiled-coil domain-containing protein n=1 Tax=Strigamia maritima TaxID=126957 RepID=T1JNL7_STRMM
MISLESVFFSLFIPQSTSSPINSLIPSHKLNSSFDFDELSFLHVPSPDDDKMDTYTLQNEISQLKFKNSKLEKENAELDRQLIKLEDLCDNLQRECENVNHRNQCLQNQMQIMQNEFDSNVSKNADESSKWDKERVQLINERNDSERQVKDLKDELNETILELTTLRTNEEVLKQNYSEREHTFIQAITKNVVLEERLTQVNTNCGEFKERLLETLRNNEHIRRKCQDLQEELIVLYEKFYVTNFKTEIEDAEESVASLDVTLDNPLSVNTVFVNKYERESSLFDELMQDQQQESSSVHPICGKSPALDASFTFQPQQYVWKPLDNLVFMFEHISSQLNEVCATELLENANQNDFQCIHHSNQLERNKSNLELLINALDLGGNNDLASLSPNALRRHVNAQLQMLHQHIAKSQNILISLQSINLPLNVNSMHSSPIEPYQNTNFTSSQTLNRTKTILNRFSSQNSTPSHHRTRSCPILPSETTFITKGTQTEPLYSPQTKDANTRLHEAFNHKTFGTPGFSIAPDATYYDSDSITPMPRNRSSSYSEAIKRGNKEDEESEDLRFNRHLSVLREEENENSDYSSSPLICRSQQVLSDTNTSPRLRLPPPYRPPPPPSYLTFQTWENVSRIPLINIQPSTPLLEIFPNDQRFTQEIHLSLPSQRQRRAAPFPAQINPNEIIVYPLETFTYCGTPHHLSYVPSGVSTSVLESSPIVESDIMSEHLAQTSQPSMITVSDSGVDTATEKVSDAEESDKECNKKISKLGSRRRKRTLGSTGNNSAVIQRSKAVDFDFGYDICDEACCNDDSDVDVKKDILQGMTQVTNRKTFSPPTLGGTPEFIISTSPKSSLETHQPSFRRKIGESQKNRLFMPELMENSETESAKNGSGSIESETEQVPTFSEVLNPPPPCGDGPFPSLPDNFLKLLQLTKTNDKIERLTEKDVEAKFHSLLLAFRTDKFTLTNRLDLHQRQRDIAEKNIEEEVVALKENLNALSQLCNDQETREIVKRLHHHLDVLHQSTTRMSSRAEVYGAVQQEDRTNRAIEVMLLYVENLKRNQEKSTTEFEEMRRILIENNLLSEDGSENEETRRNLRSYSVTNSSIGKQASKRRASIAALPRSSSERLDGNTKFINFVNTSRNSVCNIGSRRCSLYYNLRSSFSSDPEKVVNRQAADDILIPSSSSVEHSEDEHLHRPKRLPTSRRSSKRELSISKNSEAIKLPSPDAENQTSDSVFASEDTVIDSNASDPNSKMECVSSNGSNNPNNWLISDYRTEPSSDDDVDGEEEDEEDIRPLYPNRFRPRNIADSAANLLNVSQWVNDEHLVHGVRYTVGGILFLAAIFSLLIAFFPGSHATHSCNQVTWYYSIDELLRPHLELRRLVRPPV